MKSIKLIILLSVFTLSSISAQNNYYLRRLEKLPDTSIVRNIKGQYFTFSYPDVRSAGKGFTEIADETKYNAMKSNPALLAFKRTNIAELKVVTGLALETVSMVNYINRTESDFNGGASVETIRDGVREYLNHEGEFNLQHNIYKRVLKALEYPQSILRKVVGDTNNPQKHGLHAFGEGTVQLGNFGISFSGYIESDLWADLGPVFSRLAEYKFPQNYDDPQEVETAMSELGAMIDYAFNKETGKVDPRVLPAVISFSFADLSGSVGYGLRVYDSLSLGVNLNVFNRRLSAKRIDATKFNRLVEEAFADFNTSVTGVSFDIGAHYKFKNNLSLGFSMRNFLATNTLSSRVGLDFLEASLVKDRDENGNLIFNEDGDTAVVSQFRNKEIYAPMKFSVPVITNIGMNYPLANDWDIAVDMFDIFMQDTRIDKYWNRLRIGTEYRLDYLQNDIKLALRLGYQRLWPTLGVGVKLFNIVSIDVAYYNDRRIDSDIALFQLTFML